MSIAFVFPGQGSQSIGMGKNFIENFEPARHVMEEVNEALQQDLTHLILTGTKEELTLTENAQPALLAISMAVLRVLEAESGKKASEMAQYMAGHSLGEYTALCAAGVFSLQDAVRLVRLRGQAMQKAVPVGKGSMAAIIGLDLKKVESLLVNFQSADNLCVVANDNTAEQIVISGHTEAVEMAMALATQAGAKLALKLPVSAPFHSPLMQYAADVMKDALEGTFIDHPKTNVMANVTALPLDGKDSVASLLVQQITGRVRWRETVANLAQSGVSVVIEIGAGKVLTGLNKRINTTINAFSVNEPIDIEKFLECTNSN
ncbi:MAG: ACP S-malonyltransferase [Alphaproteobacteria bacterium]|nr:ACP S-malonyltransferase [Alphaproteobacteria bacterium]